MYTYISDRDPTVQDPDQRNGKDLVLKTRRKETVRTTLAYRLAKAFEFDYVCDGAPDRSLVGNGKRLLGLGRDLRCYSRRGVLFCSARREGLRRGHWFLLPLFSDVHVILKTLPDSDMGDGK